MASTISHRKRKGDIIATINIIGYVIYGYLKTKFKKVNFFEFGFILYEIIKLSYHNTIVFTG